MCRLKNFRLVATVFLISAACLAQSTRVPTITRTVQQFGELERNLSEAKDAESRSALLADDFEERLCAEPGTPVARADWLAQSHGQRATLSQEAVHMLHTEAIYSALSTEGNQADAIVDIWRKEDGGWKLSIRYRCPASGAKPIAPVVQKKY
jgi:hypothetical protein